MPQHDALLRRCREAVAGGDLPKALVLLWRLLASRHDLLQGGLDARGCERQAEDARRSLEADGVLPGVHPAAALRALDEHLAVLEAGYEPKAVRVELSKQASGSYLLVPRRRGWSSKVAKYQPNHLEHWMRRHHVVPRVHAGIAIEIRSLPERILKILDRPSLPFAAGGFRDAVLPVWSADSPLRCSALTDPTKRSAAVEALLTEAAGKRAAVLVLPELTVDATVRGRLQSWLREAPAGHVFALVVAGSFHEDGSGSPEGAGPRRNVARVFDGFGGEVLSHVKLQPMRVLKDGQDVLEGIEGGAALALLDAPFGLVAVAICLDFCEGGGTPVANLWRMVGPALVLVPSMGMRSTNNAHARRAKELALQHGTATVVASQHPKLALARGFCWQAGSPALHAAPVLYGVLRFDIAMYGSVQ